MAHAPEWAQVLGAIHGDKEAVLREQLGTIAAEIRDRKGIHDHLVRNVEADLSAVSALIARLQPANPFEADVHRTDWLLLEGQRLDLARELRAERRECWRDVQHLRTEQREVQRELAETSRRQERTDKLLS